MYQTSQSKRKRYNLFIDYPGQRDQFLQIYRSTLSGKRLKLRGSYRSIQVEESSNDKNYPPPSSGNDFSWNEILLNKIFTYVPLQGIPYRSDRCTPWLHRYTDQYLLLRGSWWSRWRCHRRWRRRTWDLCSTPRNKIILLISHKV